jgi:hypothetical protein
MGEMLKDFRENRENIIHLKVERNNKMTSGGSPSTRCLLIAFLHPLIRPKSVFARQLARPKQEEMMILP